MDKEGLLKIYRYIRICLYYHHGWEFNRRKMLKDMQHDIFLYLIDKKGKDTLNPQTKRYIFILANYYPIYLKNYKYSRKAEEVLLDIEGEPIEPGVSYFINGDVLHDLNLIEAQKPKEVLSAKSNNIRPILITYFDDKQEIYDNIEIFSSKEHVRLSTAYMWIRNGVPKRTTHSQKRHIRLRVGKYDHIKKIEYLVP